MTALKNLLAVSLVPVSVTWGVLAALRAIDSGIVPEMVVSPTGFWAQWIAPFRWAKIRRESSGSVPGKGVSRAD